MATWKEDFFSPVPKISVYYRRVIPEKTNAHLLLIHGYAEHSGRYLRVMERLAEAGISVWAPDHRGFGRSAKHLGDMKSFEDVLSDLGALKDIIVREAGKKPFYMLGHSLGGSLALCLAGMHGKNVAGTIVIAPTIMVPDYVSPLLAKLSGLIAALMPRLQVQFFQKKHISRDENVLDEARRDPYYYRGRIMARTGCQMLAGIRTARAALPEITCPILVLHAGEDKIMPIEGSRHIIKTVRSRDKRLKIFDKLYHEILNEPEKETVFRTILAWIAKHGV